MRQGKHSQGEQGTWRGGQGVVVISRHIAFSINLSLLIMLCYCSSFRTLTFLLTNLQSISFLFFFQSIFSCLQDSLV